MKKKVFWAAGLLLCGCLLTGCQKDKEQGEDTKDRNDKKKEVLVISDSGIEVEASTEDGAVEEEPSAGQAEKKGILIAIDPGHQSSSVDMSAMEPNAPGSDVMKMKATGGTSGTFSGNPEYQLNLDIALAVRDQLAAQGYDVIMTREDNETAISNAERASLANDMGADVSIRIHANGSEDQGANGALMLIGSGGNPYMGHLYDESYRLAETVLNSYCNATGMQNLGIQLNDTMTGINWSQIPVVILEMGFMTNEQDDLNMADAGYRTKMVEGIVSGINAYYGY